MRRFDDLAVDNFFGLVNRKSTLEQVRETLTMRGISFREYPSSATELQIVFSHEFGGIEWSCHIHIRDAKLFYSSLNYYDPISDAIYIVLRNELIERYKGIYKIEDSSNPFDGTITTRFENDDNPYLLTELIYDSSPILKQKNIYINYMH